MLSFKPFAVAATLVFAAAATPYSVQFQEGTAAVVENSASCTEGGTCKDAGCRNGAEACAVLPSGTVCLDSGDADETSSEIEAASAADASVE